MKNNKSFRLLPLIRRERLYPLSDAVELKGPAFPQWLTDNLGVNVEMVNFGWSDFSCWYLKAKNQSIGGP